MSSMRRRAAAGGSDPAAESTDNAEAVVPTTRVTEIFGDRREGSWLVFMLLVAARLAAAWMTMIADCDETFNYWEPAHFITFGYGFQTWEYSPLYALRSYLFLLPHAAAARAFSVLQGRPAAFFLTRSLQALIAAAVECAFVSSVSCRFGAAVGTRTGLLLALSPGMFVASVAFLPSSIAMLQVCAVWALWLRGHVSAAIFVGACAVIVVWPFTGLLFVPLGLHALWALGASRAIVVAVASFSFWSLLSLAVDSYFYGRTVLPVLEMLRYNVFDRDKHGGSELYGVEPWHFYIVNGALNLNVALPAALILPLLVSMMVLFQRFKPRVFSGTGDMLAALGFCIAAYLWFALFSAIPHKEERFLAPAYPILLFAAAITVQGAVACLSAACGRLLPLPVAGLLLRPVGLLGALFILLASVLSLSRTGAVLTGYRAPVSIYQALSEELSAFRQGGGAEDAHVCIGGEWHRFMSSFFLPDRRDHLSYVRFGPAGLLPAEFNITLGTSGIPPHMNDRNMEEPSRYIEPDRCNFLVDLAIGEGHSDIANLRRQHWDIVMEVPFLDASKSRQPWRSFYVPGLSPQKNTYAAYRLLRRSTHN